VNDSPQSISEVVELAAQRHDASGRQLAQIAQAHGFQITAATVNKLRSRTNKYAPSPETVRVIAWLANVSEEVAFTAAGQPVPGPPLGEELPPGADLLPPKARKAIIDYTRVLIDQQEQIRELTQQLEQAAGPAGARSGGGAPARSDIGFSQKNVETTRVNPIPSGPQEFDLAAGPERLRAREWFDDKHGAEGEEDQDAKR